MIKFLSLYLLMCFSITSLADVFPDVEKVFKTFDSNQNNLIERKEHKNIFKHYKAIHECLGKSLPKWATLKNYLFYAKNERLPNFGISLWSQFKGSLSLFFIGPRNPKTNRESMSRMIEGFNKNCIKPNFQT